ncbi:MAG: hypothetical protein AAF698_04525 [Pseudomonadota bacterium]
MIFRPVALHGRSVPITAALALLLFLGGCADMARKADPDDRPFANSRAFQTGNRQGGGDG